jgi:acyl carrier protein
MTEAEIREQLRAWIMKRARDKPASLRDDMPILGSGILTSLDVVELILYIEQLRGGLEVSIEALEPSVFRDVNSIYRTFFALPEAGI